MRVDHRNPSLRRTQRCFISGPPHAPTRVVISTLAASAIACGASEHSGDLQTPDVTSDAAELEALVASNFPPDDRLCGARFEPDERPVASLLPELRNVADHEFDPIGQRIVFTDDGGDARRVVVATIDPVDGDVRPDSIEFVDDDGISLQCPGVPFGNGPEWGASATSGTALYYGKLDDGVPVVARAQRTTSGEWFVERLAESAFRACAISSVEPDQPRTWLGLTRTLPNNGRSPAELVWRLDEADPTERVVPGIEVSAITGGAPDRKVPGRLELAAAVLDDGGQPQIAQINLVTEEVTFISAYRRCATTDLDCSDTELNSVSVIRVPRLGPNAFIFYGIVNNSFIDAYLVVDAPNWRAQLRLPAIRPDIPPDDPRAALRFLIDEENFIDRRGVPFVVFSMGVGPNNGQAGDIWIASFLGRDPCRYRRITADEPGEVTQRVDLDSLTIPGTTTFVYFQRPLPNGDRVLFRAATGL